MAEDSAGNADRVRRLFDGQAATWPARYAPGGRLTGRLACFAAVLSWHLPAGGRVLDLGCGTGELARAAAESGFRVSACDIAELMLRTAEQQDPGRTVEWVRLCPQWRRLPFPPAAFDAVVAASVLEYVDDPAAVLGECARVLRPGGLVVCTVPDPWHPVRWLESLAGVAARWPHARAAGRRWPPLEGYMTYLRTSQTRHTARWWCAAALRAGLHPVACPVAEAGPSPLRLLTFGRRHAPVELS
jgi:SAM-dependent methyltransferase